MFFVLTYLGTFVATWNTFNTFNSIQGSLFIIERGSLSLSLFLLIIYIQVFQRAARDIRLCQAAMGERNKAQPCKKRKKFCVLLWRNTQSHTHTRVPTVTKPRLSISVHCSQLHQSIKTVFNQTPLRRLLPVYTCFTHTHTHRNDGLLFSIRSYIVLEGYMLATMICRYSHYRSMCAICVYLLMSNSSLVRL